MEDEQFHGGCMFSLRSFGISTSELDRILSDNLYRVRKQFSLDEYEAAEYSFSFGVNRDIVKLEAEGKITINENYPSITKATMINDRVVAPNMLDMTQDNYSVFAFGMLPPTGGTPYH
jgi:hypothetical protein